MRNKVFSLLLSILVVTALVIAACGSNETEIIKKSICNITFNTAGAKTPTPEPIKVGRGKSMGAENKYPADPENAVDNITFYGWYDSDIQYGKDTVINSDLDLVARWVRNSDLVTITFDSNGGTDVPAIKVVKDEAIGLRLPITRKKNYTFDGWFLNTTQYTADAPVITGAVTLTAKWTEKPLHTVTFQTNDRNILGAGSTVQQCQIDPIQVHEGEGLEDLLPGADTVKHTASDIKFISWTGPVTDTDKGVPYDGFTAINEDMTFYAKWGKDPYTVDLALAELVNGDTFNLAGDTGPVRNADPVYNVLNEVTGGGVGSIMNSVMFDGAKNRWQILYRIGLGLPADFNMNYYARYTVRANFYGNNRAIKTDPLYSVGYMNDDDAITAVGQLMPPKAGYGQISWCVTKTSNGNPGQDKPGVIAQQYNLGTTTINNQWQKGGSYEGSDADAIHPNYLLIQTSDNWIGWIEITEIIFHNGEDEFVPPPADGG